MDSKTEKNNIPSIELEAIECPASWYSMLNENIKKVQETSSSLSEWLKEISSNIANNFNIEYLNKLSEISSSYKNNYFYNFNTDDVLHNFSSINPECECIDDIDDNFTEKNIPISLSDSTNSDDINLINKQFLSELKKHTPYYLWLLKHTDFEDGMNNAAIDYVRIFLKKNYFVTISWLNIIYSENQNDQEILSALLRVIAMTIKKEDSNKLLPLVKAGLNEQNVNTQESAIIVIEQWRTKECLLALESTKFESRMIKEYADEVKKELIKELHDVIKDDR